MMPSHNGFGDWLLGVVHSVPVTFRSRSVPLPALMLAVLLSACRSPENMTPGLEPVFDLAAHFVAAEQASETRVITFSAPEERRSLISGWSGFEHDSKHDRGFAWGLGDLSIVELLLLAPRDVGLSFEVRPLRFHDAPQQVVVLEINGEAVSEIELDPELAEYEVTIPRAMLRAGINVLELGYRWSRSPQELGLSEDPRRLAVAWYEIRFAPGDNPEPRAEAGRLFLPFGSRVDFFLEAREGSELRAERWSVRGEVRGVLEISQQTEGGPAVSLAEITGRANRAIPLTLDSKRLVRLSLSAVPDSGSSRGVLAGGPLAGFVLDSPALWSPSSQSPMPVAVTADEETNPAGSVAFHRPNIVLYVIDTLRADHLGCYGYPRPVSPRIDAFANEAVLFEHAVAQSSWTRSSMASVCTGLWPLAHGTNRRSDRLSPQAVTLPERLATAGYRTAAFVTNPNLTEGFGFDQGFEDFFYLGEQTGADGVHQAAVSWLDDRRDALPFFLYLHTLDPHAPYTAPESYRKQFAPGVEDAKAQRSLQWVDDLQAARVEVTPEVQRDLLGLYDAEIAFNDHFFGALVEALEARGLYDDILLFLMSDHGEEFYDHGNWQHGRALHTESIDVPLIVKLPASREGLRVARRVQQIDVLPTVLEAVGLPADASVSGSSLLPLMVRRASTPAPEQRVFSYLHLDGPARLSVQDGEWKLIAGFDDGRLFWPRLYLLPEDPGELHNLAEEVPIRAGYLMGLLREKLAFDREALASEEAVADATVLESLEALGYIN